MERIFEWLRARTDHEVYIEDRGRMLLRDPDTGAEYFGWVTWIGCKQCDVRVESSVPEQQAIVSGDRVAYRFMEDFTNAKLLAERECKLGMLRTKRTARQLENREVQAYLEDVAERVGEAIGLPLVAKLKPK